MIYFLAILWLFIVVILRLHWYISHFVIKKTKQNWLTVAFQIIFELSDSYILFFGSLSFRKNILKYAETKGSEN